MKVNTHNKICSRNDGAVCAKSQRVFRWILRMRALTLVWVFALLVLVPGMTARAQQTTGTIVGTVKDQTGAVVGTATVKATNVDTGFSRSTKTSSVGEYRIDYLPVGNYSVEAEGAGFKRFVQQNLDLSVDQTLTLEIALSVGAAIETITVTEAPPAINSSDAVLGRTVERAEIVGLPLVNRNIYTEVSLTPGVMANNNSPSANPSGNPTMATGLYIEDVQINGSIDGGSAGVAFYLDGGNNITGMRNYGNPSPNPDAVEEFRVETSAFGAQYGQFSSAVVSVITKSGTNQFHGGAFEFNRNTDFNANSWAPAHNAAGQIIVSPYHRNQFGAYGGGPIKKDKAFFFFSYAGTRQITSTVFTGALTPTAAERLGDFTQDTFTVKNPGTSVLASGVNASPGCATTALATAVPGHCIATALLDTTISNLDNVSNTIGSSIPLPNGALNPAKGGGAYSGLFSIPTQENEYLGKYDQNLGAKDHLSATYFFSRNVLGNSPGGNIPWTINNNASDGTNVNLADVHTFNSSLTNQTWLTFTRAAGGRVNLPVTGPATQTLASYGSNFLIQGPPSLPSISETNFSATATNAGPFTGSDNYELRDMVSLTKGRHTLYLGGEFALDKTMFFANLLNFGSISFATSAPTSTGNVTSDWVTGQASSVEQDSPYTTHLSTWHTAVFAQDDFRVTPQFTVNLGIRWDFDTPPVDSHNRTESFIPGQQSTIAPLAPKGLLFPGDAGIGRGIVSTSLLHLSPRFGFALDPFRDGKSSIRGAFGIFYGTVAGNEWNQPGNAVPFALRPQTGEGPLNSITNFYSTPGDFPTTAAGGGLFPYIYSPSKPVFISGPGGATEAISPKFKYPYIYQMNLSVQRQLPGRITLTTAYVAALSHQLPNFIDANYVPYSTAFGTPSTSATSIADRRQFDPCVGACPTGAAAINNGTGVLGAQIVDLLSNLTASYHSLQVSASKQLTHSFNVSGFYVWSHALDLFEPDADGLSSPQDSGYFGKPFSAFNNSLGAVGGGLQEEKGPMNADLRSNAAISGTWHLEYFHGSNNFVKELVNGWQISPIAYFHSGGVVNPTTGANKSFDSTNNQRPNAVAGQSPVLSAHRCRVCSTNNEVSAWFNTAAYTPNGPGVAGGVGPGGADGNVGRNSLYGPGFKDIDMGLFRDIKFEHGVVFQLRGEATNVFNLVSLSNPTASLASSNYGKITSATGTQRVIQLGGRLTF
jgi:hypothetical protein